MTQKPISDLERDVMNVVWELDQCSVRDVMGKLSQSKKLAYTTVATIFQRLYNKGLVIRKGEGVSFLYSPKLTKEAYSKTLARSFVSRFFNAFGDVAIASFAESIDSLPKKEKEHLLELLEEYDKTK